MTLEDRIQALKNRAVTSLVEAHRVRADEPLLLAVRFEIDDPLGVGLFEVVDGFPGDDDDGLLSTDYEPSARLRLAGPLRLVLGSPGQVLGAVARNDDAIRALRQPSVVFEAGSDDGRRVREALGL